LAQKIKPFEEQVDPEPMPIPAAEEKVQYFKPYEWRGSVKGFLCCHPGCSIFEVSKDDMIEHILTHYPNLDEEGLMALLDKLLKEV
jgi:argonaute-like protein implicated in RNA metabolism and viral defense